MLRNERWFFQVKPDSDLIFEQHGLYSTISSLLLELEPGHLASDKINVRCEATVRSSHEVEPFVDIRNTEVFVQGLATLTAPSLCLLIAAVLQRFLLPFPKKYNQSESWMRNKILCRQREEKRNQFKNVENVVPQGSETISA
ncbi:hypothetical protein G5I_10755 [Acromyrmex echinatior]|uniref:Uncharacterized protein n=1 Tax=Acromyrmex echinatior TaxID=103372 RepID=F4WXR5_ACREC|nr:hypothetical protein G5I_10755 [Acromyrmex echinatior]